MAIQWNIVNMQRVLNDGFVIVADWTCTAMDQGQSAYTYGAQTFLYDPAQPGFVPYDQLTSDIVVGWVQAAMGPTQVAEIEANVTTQLNALLNPQTANGLPWSQA